MRQLQPFADERLAGFCFLCGGPPETRDHVPPKVFLDEPYPENLPVVGACRACNEGMSMDEQYAACFVECVVSGSAEPDVLSRPKVARILSHNAPLQARIDQARVSGEWRAELPRLEGVVSKLVRGHYAFELAEVPVREPDALRFGVFSSISEMERWSFETEVESSVYAEVGSRAMIRAVERSAAWQEVQQGRYRYVVALVGHEVVVRVVMSEYLWCTAEWS